MAMLGAVAPLLVSAGLAYLAATLGWLTDPKSDFWGWTEHLSWAVIILGFPAAIWQLAILIIEQRQVAHELAQRADITVFFEEGSDLTVAPPILSTSCQIHPVWKDGRALSEGFNLHILARNVGERTPRGRGISWPEATAFPKTGFRR